MGVDFTEKAKRYQAIDEIIASGTKPKWSEIIENHDLALENIKINNKPNNDRIIFTGAPNKEVSTEIWRNIEKALSENLVITFDYTSLTDPNNPHQRRVQPWQLIFDNGNWSLHGLDIVKNVPRRYTLSEMRNLELTKEVFILPKNYDFRKMTPGAFGCMCDAEFLNYKIHLHGYAARYVKNRVWGENQTIVKDEKNPGPNGDGIILSFRTNQFMPIARWVWQWVDEAKPLEPEKLVKDWEEKVDRMRKM